MPRNTNLSTLVYVTIPLGAQTLKYGFRSRLRDTLRNNFGQTVIADGVSIQGLVLGANSPKPSRASKRELAGYEGSFCSSANIKALRDAGYRITRGKPSKIQGGNFNDSFYATVNGLKIAFQSNGIGSIGAQESGFPSAFGLTLATSADAGQLVYGTEFPQLPSWEFELANGKSFSSKADPSRVDTLAVTPGYKEKEAGSYTPAHFSALYGFSAV